ncbi:GNAT family N-acetyltransferase [Sulfitobacter sp. D35]|uniref:GNAT family N-acetyltransferase n=1 Tax=Sulfitobacter sp. D35 TaxID=3083252 RepID=UPI00296E6D51|nr:GNAT family N-acetyltransferase [Sulfitobacter sp. D35]MDW4498669.1 GNAT family N-acetyltransferase [Sulfitobacter sp. D35]
MTVTFREARRTEVAEVVALLREDVLGAGRELQELESYLAAFDAMQAEAANLLIVGAAEEHIVATYQITFISGLSLSAMRRAQVEAVRVSPDMRGQGVGDAMFADIERRARAAGCGLIQLTSNKTRTDALRFYRRLGFTASHEGFKRMLD